MKSLSLKNKRILITGCGYKPVEFEFEDVLGNLGTHDEMEIKGKRYKLNIGSAVAMVLVEAGATVHLVSRTSEKLEQIKKHIVSKTGCDESKVEYSVCDLLDEKNVRGLVSSLKKDKILYWVQTIGLGAGAYKVKNNNPYLHIKDIPIELIEKESQIVLRGTHLLMQNLLPVFRKQNKKYKSITKISIVTSMSAVRGYNRGGTHCAAKGAISRYTNSAMLDLWKEKIYITDVRPGAVDTGMYDSKAVQEAVFDISDEYGCLWSKTGAKLMPPTAAGEIVKSIFEAEVHVPSVNMVAMGQIPHEGS